MPNAKKRAKLVASARLERGVERWEEAIEKLKSDAVKHANECAVLVSHLGQTVQGLTGLEDDEDPKDWIGKHGKEVVSIVDALQRYFESVQANASLQNSKSEASVQFLDWNKQQLKTYQSTLKSFCQSRSCPADVRAEMVFAVIDSIKLETGKRFQVENLDFVLHLLCCGNQLTQVVLDTFSTEYLKYVDVTFYSLKYLGRLCSDMKEGKKKNSVTEFSDGADTLCNIFDLLRALTKSVRGFLEDEDERPLSEHPCLTHRQVKGKSSQRREKAEANEEANEEEEEEEEGEERGVGGEKDNVNIPKFLREKSLKQVFTSAWLAFLRLPLPTQVLKRALTMLPEEIMKMMTTPILLSDVFANCVDQKGLIGILALHGLFVLVVEYGLEYPNFYRQLYSMITISTFLTKYRAKFYRLVDTFLSTPLIPAYVVAAFIKRFARLAVQAPPHGALLAMSFIFNLIRRHPSCVIVLEDKNESRSKADPYDANEDDPAKARALESSLWELETLKSHYHHEVARFVSVFKRDMTKRNKYTEIDIEKFVTRSYDETYSSENTKRLKMCGIRYLAEKERKSLF